MFMARMLRRNQVDLSRTTVYHVVSRCTRALHLLKGLVGEQEGGVASVTSKASRVSRDCDDYTAVALPRKDWILLWLRELATQFAMEVVGFSIM